MKGLRRLTVSQMKILNNNGVTNAEDYAYIKTEYVDASGNKCPSKLKDKHEILVVYNKVTGKEERYEVRIV